MLGFYINAGPWVISVSGLVGKEINQRLSYVKAELSKCYNYKVPGRCELEL